MSEIVIAGAAVAAASAAQTLRAEGTLAGTEGHGTRALTGVAADHIEGDERVSAELADPSVPLDRLVAA